MQTTILPLVLVVTPEQKQLVLDGGFITDPHFYVPDVGRLLRCDREPGTLVGLFRLVSNNGKKLLLTADLHFDGELMCVTGVREHMSRKVLAEKHFFQRVRGDA